MGPNGKNQLVAAVTKECIVSHGNIDSTCDVMYPMVTLIQLVVTVM